MSVTYGFFNSLNGDRVYNADQMSEYFQGLISNGVCANYGGALQVQAGSGMEVLIQPGRAYIDSKWIKIDSPESITISESHVSLSRYTAIGVHLDNSNRLMEFIAVDGTPSSNPVRPTLDNTDIDKYLILAYVEVVAQSTSVKQENIIDTRANNALCGWVTGLITQVDTSTLFAQWEAAYDTAIADMQAWQTQMQSDFDTWFETLTEELGIITYLDEYTKRVLLSTGITTRIPLDMTGYTYGSTDIIKVYINGLLGTDGTDYTLNTSESTPTLIPVATAIGTEIYISVIKSRIGSRQSS
jgi:hypothetical protein